MKKITRDMLKIYVPYSNMDWMNYKLVPKDLTAHHIIKRIDGGRTQGNIALLMPPGHEYLHLIETRDETCYNLLNRMFLIILNQMREPTKDQRQIIEYILRDFEAGHRDDLNCKGEPLIKEKYYKRMLL